jgi:hypothetical protein
VSLELVLGLAFLALVAHLWQDGLRARERALAAARRACQELDVQLLDQTVALRRLALERGPTGWLRLRREFGFEFSAEGTERRAGSAVVVAGRVESVHLDHPEGPVVLPRGG